MFACRASSGYQLSEQRLAALAIWEGIGRRKRGEGDPATRGANVVISDCPPQDHHSLVNLWCFGQANLQKSRIWHTRNHMHTLAHVHSYTHTCTH